MPPCGLGEAPRIALKPRFGCLPLKKPYSSTGRDATAHGASGWMQPTRWTAWTSTAPRTSPNATSAVASGPVMEMPLP